MLYDKFLRYLKDKEIILCQYQLEFCKSFLDNPNIIIINSRQSGRNFNYSLLRDFIKWTERN